ncbi:unnamed protein product [Rhizophagus irregularis]|nr:unnamed protein product [Rhizophagus irregularis]CAB4446406.1 unnamed protein product [Rhizophagus irregularis]
MDLTQFNQAELKRRELIGLKKLGPRISHPKAIYTSRPLSFFISKCSSINFSKEYISMELDFDIDIERSKVLGTKRNIEELYIDDSHGNNGNTGIKISSSYPKGSFNKKEVENF